jgi:hypothetical protein
MPIPRPYLSAAVGRFPGADWSEAWRKLGQGHLRQVMAKYALRPGFMPMTLGRLH